MLQGYSIDKNWDDISILLYVKSTTVSSNLRLSFKVGFSTHTVSVVKRQ